MNVLFLLLIIFVIYCFTRVERLGDNFFDDDNIPDNPITVTGGHIIMAHNRLQPLIPNDWTSYRQRNVDFF